MVGARPAVERNPDQRLRLDRIMLVTKQTGGKARSSSRTFPPAAPAAACLLLCAGALAEFARPAVAQTWDARGFLTINGGQQAASPDFSDNIAFTDFAEEGDFDARYATGSDTVFDAGGGIRVWRNLGIGAGVSLFSHTGDAGITARIPHPFFDRHRAVDGTEPGFAREETAVCTCGSSRPAARSTSPCRPGRRSLPSSLVTGVNYDHAYPYDVATLSGTTNKGSRPGSTSAATWRSTSPSGSVSAGWCVSAADRPCSTRRTETPSRSTRARCRPRAACVSVSDPRTGACCVDATTEPDYRIAHWTNACPESSQGGCHESHECCHCWRRGRGHTGLCAAGDSANPGGEFHDGPRLVVGLLLPPHDVRIYDSHETYRPPGPGGHPRYLLQHPKRLVGHRVPAVLGPLVGGNDF